MPSGNYMVDAMEADYRRDAERRSDRREADLDRQDDQRDEGEDYDDGI